MRTADLDYPLPDELIATAPAEPRDGSRLMLLRRRPFSIGHHHVRDLPRLPDLLRRGDLLVFNQSKVIPAQFHAIRSRTGGRVEGLYLGPVVPPPTPTDDRPASAELHDPCTVRVMLESRGRLLPHERVDLSLGCELELLRREEDPTVWRAGFRGPISMLELLGHVGHTPLPPYIRRQRKARGEPVLRPEDADRYNTVYAADPGSIAAPTAGLHFTDPLREQLWCAGVHMAHLTLHVGPATFAPVRADRLADHVMHSEQIVVPAQTIDALRRAREEGRRIIPVGTTSVRALESLPDPLPDSYTGATDLFIRPPAEPDEPPFAFRFTDGLITNFHLPRSTLIALVAALPDVGLPRLLECYRAAIEQRYRFYSYGDAMLIL